MFLIKKGKENSLFYKLSTTVKDYKRTGFFS